MIQGIRILNLENVLGNAGNVHEFLSLIDAIEYLSFHDLPA